MQVLILSIVVILVVVGWLVSAVQGANVKAERSSEAKAKMKALGLKESDLPALLAKVPDGYLERSLYWAKRRAEEAATSEDRLSVVEAVVNLHQALAEHEKAEQRAKIAAEEKQRRNAEIMSLASSCGPPERQQLIIRDSDFSRENEADRTFRRVYLLRLLALYDNACGICGSRENGLDLDHFFVPKSQGGNFVLIRTDGLRVNNAVPMCESCNRAKGNRDWRKVASDERLKLILSRNAEVNKLVNQT